MADEPLPAERVAQRGAEKEAQRQIDRDRLARGEVTAAELQEENNFFRGLGPFKIVAIGKRRVKTPF